MEKQNIKQFWNDSTFKESLEQKIYVFRTEAVYNTILYTFKKKEKILENFRIEKEKKENSRKKKLDK